MNWRYHFLSTFPYSYNLLDPTTITSLFYLYFSIYFSLPQTLLSSENVVAPSASTINAYLPRTKHIPALTAPPFPLFLGYQTTTKLRLSFSACSSATQLVRSLLPSLTTMISCLVLFALKKAETSASISGKRYCSLQAGTTSEMSGYGYFQSDSRQFDIFFLFLLLSVTDIGQYWRASKFFFQFLQGWINQRTTMITNNTKRTPMQAIILEYYYQ